jgi:hypothetical protein
MQIRQWIMQKKSTFLTYQITCARKICYEKIFKYKPKLTNNFTQEAVIGSRRKLDYISKAE